MLLRKSFLFKLGYFKVTQGRIHFCQNSETCQKLLEWRKASRYLSIFGPFIWSHCSSDKKDRLLSLLTTVILCFGLGNQRTGPSYFSSVLICYLKSHSLNIRSSFHYRVTKRANMWLSCRKES